MNATQRRRHVALLQSTGYEDSPALTVQSTDGEIPQGRELSFAWLTGTVMTGLTNVRSVASGWSMRPGPTVKSSRPPRANSSMAERLSATSPS